MFRKMHRFHRWDFGTENHVLLYPKKHASRESQILNCSVMGSMQLTQFFTTFWTAKKILIWRAYVVLFHQDLLQLKPYQAHLDKIVVNQVKNLWAFQDSFFHFNYINFIMYEAQNPYFIPKYAEEPKPPGILNADYLMIIYNILL